MRILGIVLCLLASPAMAADDWRMVVYEGDAVKAVDTSAYGEAACKAKADVNNQAMRAGADIIHQSQKKTGPVAPPRITVKCEQR